MPTFNHQPPDDLGRSGYRLLRTPPAHAMIGYVLSDTLVGCNTHWVNNRTQPCEAPDCDPCNSGIPWRWHGYLICSLERTQEVIIFEMTARASRAFAAYHERHGTTRGAHFKSERLNGRHNGRLLIQVKPADLAKIHLPKAPPIEKLLCHIWNIPEPDATIRATQTRPPFPQAQVHRQQTTLPFNPDAVPQPTAAAAIPAAADPNKNGDREP